MQRDSTYDTQGAAARDAPARDGGWRDTCNNARSLRAGTIRHRRARRAGAPFTRPSDVQTQRRPQSFAGAARRLHKCSRAASHTPQGGITRVHACPSHGQGLVLVAQHCGPSLRRSSAAPGGTYVPRAECPPAATRVRAQAASSVTGAAAVNRAWLRVETHGWPLLPLMRNLRDCCDARAARPTRGAALELQHEPPSLTRSSRSALL